MLFTKYPYGKRLLIKTKDGIVRVEVVSIETYFNNTLREFYIKKGEKYEYTKEFLLSTVEMVLGNSNNFIGVNLDAGACLSEMMRVYLAEDYDRNESPGKWTILEELK